MDTDLMRSIFTGDVVAVQGKVPIRGANEALLALLAALTVSHPAIVRLILNRVPNEDETENRVEIYKTVWNDHTHMMDQLALLGERVIGEIDTVHHDVFCSLLDRFSGLHLNSVARLLPSNKGYFGEDWAAVIKSPSIVTLHDPETVAVQGDIQEVLFSADGRYLAYSTSVATELGCSIHIREVATGVALGDYQVTVLDAVHTSLACDGHCFYLAWGDGLGSIRVARFTVDGNPQVNVLLGSHNGPVLAISSSSNGLRLISGAGQGPFICVWDCHQWTRLRSWGIEGRPLEMAVALSPNGELAGLALSHQIQVWCVDSSATAVYHCFNTRRTGGDLTISFNDNPSRRLVRRAVRGMGTIDILRITQSQESSGLKSILSLEREADVMNILGPGPYKEQVQWSPGNEWFLCLHRNRLSRLLRTDGNIEIFLFPSHPTSRGPGFELINYAYA